MDHVNSGTQSDLYNLLPVYPYARLKFKCFAFEQITVFTVVPFLGKMQYIAFRLMLSSCVCVCVCVCACVRACVRACVCVCCFCGPQENGLRWTRFC